jgi:F-type H+-transporting ATPase subunit a
LKTKDLIRLVFFLLFAGTTISASGRDAVEENKEEKKEESEEAFDASTFIMEHIADSHEWHLFTKGNGESVAIYLPVILYSKEKGLDIFSSKKLAHGHTYNG